MKSSLLQYNKAPKIKLPILTEFLPARQGRGKIRLTSLTGACHNCTAKIKDPHGIVTEHQQCLEVNYHGKCPSCGEITNYHFRWFPLQKRMVHFTSLGSEEYQIVTSKIEKIFFRIFYWFFKAHK